MEIASDAQSGMAMQPGLATEAIDGRRSRSLR
jgi:hypothetical protein